jgi:hypothetical protein
MAMASESIVRVDTGLSDTCSWAYPRGDGVASLGSDEIEVWLLRRLGLRFGLWRRRHFQV